MEVSGHSPAALPLGRKPPVPTELEAVWAPELVWKLQSRTKISSPSRESDQISSAVHAVAWSIYPLSNNG